MRPELGASILGFIVFVGPRFEVAHGPTNLVKGSLLTVDDDQIVIATGSGRIVTITISRETRFRYENGATARSHNLKEGDRVAVEIQTIGGSHVAEQVRLDRPVEDDRSRGGNP